MMPSLVSDPLAAIEQAILETEHRRDQQRVYIAHLEGEGISQAPARMVLSEIEATLRTVREHHAFLLDLFAE